jgi:hypothetical protein
MHEETIIVEFEPDRAKRALPRLRKTAADRRHAHELLQAMETHFRLEARQHALMGELRSMLPIAVRANAEGRAVPRANRRAKREGKRAAARTRARPPAASS